MNRRRSLRWTNVLTATMLALVVLAPATTALARNDEPDEVIVDARLEGYKTFQELPEASNGGTWVVFVLLMAVTAGGLFKDAKRTHLD